MVSKQKFAGKSPHELDDGWLEMDIPVHKTWGHSAEEGLTTAKSEEKNLKWEIRDTDLKESGQP